MMKKILSLIMVVSVLIVALAGCSQSSAAQKKEYDTISIVWYPNESGEDMKSSRDDIAKVIEEATGKKVDHKLTTDYTIAIETIANGNAQLAFMGAQGYIEANNKNSAVLPVCVPSGSSGTLDDAMYYSWLNVRKGEEDQHKVNGQFTIENIQGKRFSFVSISSTSGFKVPSSGIATYFSQKEQWKDITAEDLMEGGKDNFFTEVLYGGSHQGSAVNLLTNRADIAAFCDTSVANYVEIVSGEESRPGAVYKVSEGAADPFTGLSGKEFVIISSTPVLNDPFVMNTDVLTEEDQKAIVEAMTSEETANNTKIFVPKDSGEKGLFTKTKNERFLAVEDAWFNPIRELSK
jgi:phosphonate transport system substrate-binding protein